MGNNSSHTATKGATPVVVAPVKVEPFRPVTEVVRTQKINAHYGEHKVVRDKKTGQEYIQKEIVLNNKQTFDNEVNYIKNRINLKHDNVINVLGYDTEEKSGFCATHYKIILYIEPLARTLDQEITERQKKQQYYPEYELRSIAVSLINGLAFFQSKGFSHGDIRPSNIFLDEKTKNVKLSDPNLHQTKGFNGLLAHIIRKEKSFLAPELLANVPKERLEFKGNANKADVYSLGMTLLALATLNDSGDLYDYKHGKIQEELLHKRIESVNRNYPGGGVESIIRVMLNANPEQRADFVALSSQYGQDFHQHHHHEVSHSYEVSHSHNEIEKRSAHVVHHVDDHSDLEARIKAALERSAQTFKSVSHSSTYTPSTYHHEYTATPVQHHVDYSIPSTQHHETVVRSTPSHHVEYNIPTHHYESAVSSVPAHHEYTIPTTHHHEAVVSSIPSHHAEYTIPTTHHHADYTIPTTYHHADYSIPTTHHQETVVSHHHEPAVESHHASGEDVVERALRSAMASSHLHTPTTTHQVETTSHHHHVEPVATTVSTTGQSNLRNSDFLRKSFLASHIPSAHTTTYTAPVTTHHDQGEAVKRSTHIVDVPHTHNAGGYTDVSYATYNPTSHYVSEHNVAPVSYTYTSSYTTSHAVPSTFTESVHDLHNVKQSTSVNEISNH